MPAHKAAYSQQFSADAEEFRDKFLDLLSDHLPSKCGPHLAKSLRQHLGIARFVAEFARMYVQPQPSAFLREWRASAKDLAIAAEVSEVLGRPDVAAKLHDIADLRRSRRFSKFAWWAVISIEALLFEFITHDLPTAEQLWNVLGAAREAASAPTIDIPDLDTFSRNLRAFRRQYPVFVDHCAALTLEQTRRRLSFPTGI